jgi:hypothetical protein
LNGEETQPFVADNEPLARFVTTSRWYRPGNLTVRPEAFIPHPYPELSVTRHRSLSEEDIWKIGQSITDFRSVNLHGRADIMAVEVRKQKLTVEPKPVPENLNHADITGWPADKPTQKILALELAAVARYVPKP